MKPRFGPDYYARYYGSPRTRVVDAATVGHLARGVTSLIAWWGAPLRNVLDVGAGVGHWGRWFRRHRPDVRYRSTEISRHACERYGHELRDIARWRGRERHDLVVCQGVLPYLDDDACARAIENLAAMSRGFLYLEAITRADLRDVCDTSLTDVAVHARSGRWYARVLAPHFVKVGAGLWYARSGGLGFFELERGSA